MKASPMRQCGGFNTLVHAQSHLRLQEIEEQLGFHRPPVPRLVDVVVSSAKGPILDLILPVVFVTFLLCLVHSELP
jgi:hypothetical protein